MACSLACHISPSLAEPCTFSLLPWAGTYLPDGRCIAAPGSMSSMLSSLSTAFRLLGREGPWNGVARTGNPADGIDVALLKRGYRREAHAAGFEEGSAVPWDEASVHRLIDWLDQQVTSHTAAGVQHLEKGGYINAFSSIMAALLCDRDAMLATYLWGSSQRAKEAGALKLEDFTLPGGQGALPLPRPLPIGIKVCSFIRGEAPHSVDITLSCLVAGACLPEWDQAACGPQGHGACDLHPGGRPPWAIPVHLSAGPAHPPAGASPGAVPFQAAGPAGAPLLPGCAAQHRIWGPPLQHQCVVAACTDRQQGWAYIF